MASVPRGLFNSGEFTADLLYDDVTMRAVSIHTVNRLASTITIQAVRLSDEVVVGSHTFGANSDQTFNIAGLNFAITIDGRGRLLLPVYFRTA